jgi:hypothetical protein
MIDLISPPAAMPNRPKQPAADQRADNVDHDLADQAKVDPLHDHPSKLPGDGADEQENDETCERLGLRPPSSRGLAGPSAMGK